MENQDLHCKSNTSCYQYDSEQPAKCSTAPGFVMGLRSASALRQRRELHPHLRTQFPPVFSLTAYSVFAWPHAQWTNCASLHFSSGVMFLSNIITCLIGNLLTFSTLIFAFLWTGFLLLSDKLNASAVPSSWISIATILIEKITLGRIGKRRFWKLFPFHQHNTGDASVCSLPAKLFHFSFHHYYGGRGRFC